MQTLLIWKTLYMYCKVFLKSRSWLFENIFQINKTLRQVDQRRLQITLTYLHLRVCCDVIVSYIDTEMYHCQVHYSSRVGMI